MTPRFNIFQASPEGTKAMIAVETAIAQSGLDHALLHLVKIRASQINGCAFCIDMHVKDAVKNGESHQRIHLLDGWRDSPAFTDRERAALNWTEIVTRIGKTHAPDADYAKLQTQFNEGEIAWLTLAIGAINLWNRVQIASKAVLPVEASAAAA
jgi:AhpD family alkylhydroperoxidase